MVRVSHAWRYSPASQTATVVTAWEMQDETGAVVERLESNPLPLHCLFRFEMEHLARHTEFQVEAVYGDFSKNDLTDDSSEMIWMLRK